MRAVVVCVTVAAALAACASASAQSPQSRCALAWNRGAPEALRARVAARHPRAAFVDARVFVHTIRWKKGVAPATTGGRGCGIDFVLGGDRILVVSGVWRGGRVVSWSRPVPGNRPIPVPHDATVHADGTVGFHG